MKTITIQYGEISKPNFQGIQGAIQSVTITILDGTTPKVFDNTKKVSVAFISPFSKESLTEVDASLSGNNYLVDYPALSVVNNYPYIIKVAEISTPTQFEVIAQGDYQILPLFNETDSIDQFLEVEVPEGISLKDNFKMTKKRYWQLYLAPAFTIAQELTYNESSWPVLANSLIAKLIFYDALLLAFKNNLVAFESTQQTTSGSGQAGIKTITTGPNTVEFYDVASNVSKMFQPNNGGDSIFDQLTKDIAMLCERLKINLNYVGIKQKQITITPQFYT